MTWRLPLVRIALITRIALIVLIAGAVRERGVASEADVPGVDGTPAHAVRLAIVVDPSSAKAAFLAEVATPATTCASVAAALAGDAYGVVIADATEATLGALTRDPGPLRAFTGRGGWLVLWGVAPGTLPMFNDLVGVQHLIRPFTVEDVHALDPAPRLLAGLRPGNVQMTSDRLGRFNYPLRAGDVWSFVLDGDDIAPFATLPPASHWGVGGPTEPGYDRHPPNLVNGLLDSWTERFTFDVDRPESRTWTMTFPRRETVTGFSIVTDLTYQVITGLRLSFIGSTAAPVDLDLPVPSGSDVRQDFPLPGIAATGLSIDISRTRPHATPCAVIGNLWISVERSPEFRRKVQPLLSLGVLNSYPQGAGGIIADQMRVDAPITTENRAKQKLLMRTLLRHCGVTVPRPGGH